jgi:hypothetical protein
MTMDIDNIQTNHVARFTHGMDGMGDYHEQADERKDLKG